MSGGPSTWRTAEAVPAAMLVNNGHVVQIPQTWGVSRTPDGSDNFDEQSITIGEHTVFLARRGGGISRWRSTAYGAGANGAIVRSDDFGQGLHIAEIFILRFNIDAANQASTNPNHPGGQDPDYPFESGARRTRGVPNILLHGEARSDGNTGKVAWWSIPFHFDPTGNNGQDWKLSKANTASQLLWRCRMGQTLEVNWQGRSDVHRLASWSYYPRRIDRLDGRREFRGHFSHGFNGLDLFTAGEFYDPATRTSVALANFLPTTVTAKHWDADGVLGVINKYGAISGTEAWPFTTEGAGLIFTGTSLGAQPMVLGFYQRIVRLSNSRSMASPNVLQAHYFTTTATNDEYHTRGLGMSQNSQCDDVREPGWVGHQLWIVTGKDLATVRLEIDRLHQADVARPDRLVLEAPESVLQGIEAVQGLNARTLLR